MQSGFVNGEYVSGEFIEAGVSKKIHGEAEEQADVEQSEGCLSSNWRVKSKPQNYGYMDKKRFFNQYKSTPQDRWFTGNGKLKDLSSGVYQDAKVAARHLKFCPGNNCLTYLPLYNFASNNNMSDGLDVYCIDCNLKKKEEKRQLRNERAMSIQRGDKYNGFAKSKKAPFCMMPENREAVERRQMREAEKLIQEAVSTAERRFKTKIHLTPPQILNVIFQNQKKRCQVTDRPMTLECFVDHHQPTFNVRENADGKKVMEILCSEVD